MVPWIYRITRRGVREWFYRVYRAKDYGVENLPAEGPVVLASNHASFWDPMLVAAAFPRPVGFMARDTLFRFPLFGRYISSLNAFPVNRADPFAALKVCGDRLDRGEVVLIFPEGTRTRDGRLGQMKGGAAMLAGHHHAPILPVYLWGTYQSWPRSRAWPRWHRVRVYAAPVIPPTEAGEKLPRRELERRTADALRALETRAFDENGYPPDPGRQGPAKE